MTRSASRLSSVLLACTALLASALSAKVTETFSRTYPLKADGVVALTNVNGSVEITGWDRDEVSIEAEKSASTAEGLQLLAIDIEHSPDRLAIKTTHQKVWQVWKHSKAQVHYKIKVPAGASLRKIDVVNATIRVSGVRGYVDLDSVNGAIKAEGLAAGGRFDTVNGSITASFTALKADDRIVLDTVNGSCTVVLPVGSTFSLNADSVNGGISCDFPLKVTKSGRNKLVGTVGAGGASVVLDSVNGGLRVKSAE